MTDQALEKLTKLQSKLEHKDISVEGGLSYLPAKQLLLLESLQQIMYFVLLKLEGKQIRGHGEVVDQMVITRMLLDKLRPLDSKLQYQLEKLSKQAMAQTAAAPLQPKPRPELLEHNVTTDNMLKARADHDNENENENANEKGEVKPSIYRPAKVNPVHYEARSQFKMYRTRRARRRRRR